MKTMKMDVELWSEKRVLNWLETTPLDKKYVKIFEEHRINGIALLTLSNEVLRDEMGIIPYGIRASLLYYLKQLKKNNQTPSIPDDNSHETTPINEKHLNITEEINSDEKDRSPIPSDSIESKSDKQGKQKSNEEKSKRKIVPLTVPLSLSCGKEEIQATQMIEDDEILPRYGSSDYNSDEIDEIEKQINRDIGYIGPDAKILSQEQVQGILQDSLNDHTLKWKKRFDPKKKPKSFFNLTGNDDLLKRHSELSRQFLDDQIQKILANQYTQKTQLRQLFNCLELSVFNILDCQWLLNNSNIRFHNDNKKPLSPNVPNKRHRIDTSGSNHVQYIYEKFDPTELFSDNDDNQDKTMKDYLDKSTYYSHLAPEVKISVDQILNDKIDEILQGTNLVNQEIINQTKQEQNYIEKNDPTDSKEPDTLKPGSNLDSQPKYPGNIESNENKSLSKSPNYYEYLDSGSDVEVGPIIPTQSQEVTKVNENLLPFLIYSNQPSSGSDETDEVGYTPFSKDPYSHQSTSNISQEVTTQPTQKLENHKIYNPNEVDESKLNISKSLREVQKKNKLIYDLIMGLTTDNLWNEIQKIRTIDLVRTPEANSSRVQAIIQIYSDFLLVQDSELCKIPLSNISDPSIPEKFYAFHQYKMDEYLKQSNLDDNDSMKSYSTELVENEYASSEDVSDVCINSLKIKGTSQKRRNIRQIQGDMTVKQTTLMAQDKPLDAQSQEELRARQANIIDSYLNRELKKILKPHQVDGIKFIWDNLISKESGCVLAHTMGLGKSLQAILFLDALFASIDKYPSIIPQILLTKRILILCPAYLQRNWIQEFNKWKHCRYSGNIQIWAFLENESNSKIETIEKWFNHDHILICSYHVFTNLLYKNIFNLSSSKDLRIKKLLLDPGPSLVVVDEAHIIKSSQTQLSQTLSNISTNFRICLTGHPLQNCLLEYYYMIDFALPGLLESKADFCNQFKNPIENGFYLDSREEDKLLSQQQLEKLIQMIQPWVHRLGSQVLNSYIPPKKEFDICIKLSKTQREIYDQFVKKINQEGSDNVIENGNASLIICNHPKIMKEYLDTFELDKTNQQSFGEKEETIERAQLLWLRNIFTPFTKQSLSTTNISLKFEIFVNIVTECILRKEKILIFSRSIPTLRYLYRHLRKNVITDPHSLFYMDGQTAKDLKQTMVNLFNKVNNWCAFLISIHSGAHGINLHTASKVVIFDIGWNPSLDDQAIGRCYRLGQTKPVTVYRLRTYNSWEDNLYPINQKKKTMFQKVIDQEDVYHQFNKNRGRYFDIIDHKTTQHKILSRFDDDIIDKVIERHRNSIVDIKQR